MRHTVRLSIIFTLNAKVTLRHFVTFYMQYLSKPNYICTCQRFILSGYIDLTIEIRVIWRLLDSNTQ